MVAAVVDTHAAEEVTAAAATRAAEMAAVKPSREAIMTVAALRVATFREAAAVTATATAAG
jgi:hypothetical protein